MEHEQTINKMYNELPKDIYEHWLNNMYKEKGLNIAEIGNRFNKLALKSKDVIELVFYLGADIIEE